MTHDGTLLVALFREWVDLNREYQASTDETADDRLRRRRDSVEVQIHNTPASGARGLAVKGYFLGYYHADRTPKIADLSHPGSYANNGELAHDDSRAIKSFFDDAARFVPELQSVIGSILNAPVRIPPRPEMMAALRERCETLAAEYAAPLPEGDAGIIEAMRRLDELRPRGTALYREFGITMDMEREVFIPIVGRPRDRLANYIHETPPVGLTGAIAKLRYICDPGNALVDDDTEKPLMQVLEVIERAA